MPDLKFEIFATGKWNNLSFTKKALEKIVTNFYDLIDVHKPFLKLGHNDSQEMTDGKPALGWITDLELTSANKILATAKDVPEIIKKAIEKGRYSRVSVELDLDVTYKGKEIGDVLTAVALLGADVPAVNTLADLRAYMTDKHLSESRACFSAIETTFKKEEYTMSELTELTEQMKTLSAQFTSLKKETKDLQEENETLRGQNEQLLASAKQKETEDKKVAIKLARDSVTKILEDAVTAKQILPAQRETFTKILQIDDDEAVQKIDLELVTQMVGKGSQSFTTNGSTKTVGTDDNELPVDEQVVEECHKLMASNPSLDFSTAQKHVFSTNRKLALAYRDFNDQDQEAN